MNPPLTEEARRKAQARLSEIGEAEIAALTEFAECRLMRLGRSSDAGRDIVQSAFLAVVLGLESEQAGRRPRDEDIIDKTTFEKYLRSVILSLVQCQTKTRHIKAYHAHYPIADGADEDETDRGIVLASPGPTAAERTAWNDLQCQFFSTLRSRAPQRLQRTIDAWERVCEDSDRIPADSFRKYVVELRGLAQQVIREIEPME